MNALDITIYSDGITDFSQVLGTSLLGRAQSSGIWRLSVVNLRDHAGNRWGRIDSPPAGGGAGMVLRPDVVDRALRSQGLHPPQESESSSHDVQNDRDDDRDERDSRLGLNDRHGDHTADHTADHTGDHTAPVIIHLTPQGRRLDQQCVSWLSCASQIHLVSSRFEGIDQRVVDYWRMTSVSIGDYVLCSGDLPAMVIVEACVRLRPGVLGNSQSLREESFSPGLNEMLEHPHYTKPDVWRDLKIPEILKSGHHQRIEQWRKDHVQKIPATTKNHN